MIVLSTCITPQIGAVTLEYTQQIEGLQGKSVESDQLNDIDALEEQYILQGRVRHAHLGRLLITMTIVTVASAIFTLYHS